MPWAINELQWVKSISGWIHSDTEVYLAWTRCELAHWVIRQDGLKSFVHVAGTTGKGSILSYLSSILLQAGMKNETKTSLCLVVTVNTSINKI